VDELSEKDLLQYAIDSGMIDVNTIRANIEMNERKRYLESHESKVWKASDGRWATYLPDRTSKTGRKLLKKKTKEQIEDAIVKYYKEEENDPYIEDVFNAWTESKMKYGEILPQTYDRYETDFHRFFDGEKISKVKFRFITEDMLEDFIKTTIHERNLTAKGWGNLRTVINGIFKYGKKKKLTEISITRFMGDLDLSRKAFKRRYFTDEESVFTDPEIEKITDFIHEHPSLINYGILLAFQTGLRAGEIAALQSGDLNGNVLNVTKTEERYKDAETREYRFEIRGYTKGAIGHRQVVMTEDAVKTFKALVRMNPFSEYIFKHDDTFIRSKAFSTKLYKICEHVDIRRRSLHKARKTYGTKLLNAGVNEKLIEKQMGHTDISTTKGFYYFNNTELNEAVKIIQDAIG
jgi:integrase